MPVSVELVECDFPRNLWFVTILGVPGRDGGLTVTDAMSWAEAAKLKRRVEKALSQFGRVDLTPRGENAPTSWQRLRLDGSRTSPKTASPRRKQAAASPAEKVGTKPRRSSRSGTAR